VTQSDVTVGTRLHAGDASPAADVEAVDEHEAVRLAASLVGVLTATGDVTGAPDQTVGSPDGLERTPATGAIAAGLADAGSWVPFIGHPGSGLETGVMRLGGVPVAIAVAGVSGVRELVPGDLRRLRRVVDLSGRMGAPLLLVQDCEGYSERIMSDPGTAGSLVELIGALRSLPSPILCLVCGDGHVLGTYCLGGRQVGPAAILAWPWARIGVVDTPGYEASRISPHRQAGPWLAAGMGLVDDVVTPEETGPWLRWFVRLCHDRRHIPPPPPGDRWYARPSIKGT
jgi:acetyl-CoA carboxylase carboxyltransferase component